VLYCSGSMCVGVMVWFGWGGAVSLCRLKHWCFCEFILSVTKLSLRAQVCPFLLSYYQSTDLPLQASGVKVK